MDVHEREDKPMWVRAPESTRRTSLYKVELLLGDDDQPDQDYIDIEEATPLTALQAQCQATGAELVASLQDVDDPVVLRKLARE
eukprot:7423439-Prorocentrum_lima.AAC.1